MKAYQDRTTGKWKWGTRGEAKYDTKAQCEKAGIDELTNKLRRLCEKRNKVMSDHGKSV